MRALAQEYLGILDEDEEARLALLACSAALHLDDAVAAEAISLVVGVNGSTQAVLRRIKELDCVWAELGSIWYIAEDVRHGLAEVLVETLPEPRLLELRELLAARADADLSALSPDGQISAQRMRELRFEAAYQRTVTPEKSDQGAAELVEMWLLEGETGAAEAAAEAVDYLSDEIARNVQALPLKVLFLQGMAARVRGDRAAQERYFRPVWEGGRPERIFCMAAHFFGITSSDSAAAEQALRDGIRWSDSDSIQAQVYHSLGNLLANDLRRGTEAEEAYQKSLDLLDPEPLSQAQVYHSLGNLLANDRRRWEEAEKAYQTSLDLDPEPRSQAQVYHSLGNLLAKDDSCWEKAKAAYQKSLDLNSEPRHQGQVCASYADACSKLRHGHRDFNRVENLARSGVGFDPDNPYTCGVCHRVLALFYEREGRFQEAIDQLEALQETNRQLEITEFRERISVRIDRLRRRL